jgi:Ca2+-transporting ATPase
MLLFVKIGVVAFSVVAIISDVPDPRVMDQPPRDPKEKLVNRHTSIRWFVNGLIVATSALLLLTWGPDEPSTSEPSISMTMAFATVALATTAFGLTMRREHQPAWAAPLFPYLSWIGLGALVTWLAVELPLLQRVLDTVSLTGAQWLLVVGLALIAPVLVEIDKAVGRYLSRASG